MDKEPQVIEELKAQLHLVTTERDKFRSALTDSKLQSLELQVNDHERRLRDMEQIATQFKTLYALVLGGGALSAINLILTFVRP